jgi:hypothetical protein
MTSSSSLDLSLHDFNIPTDVKRSIVNSLWDRNYTSLEFAQISPHTDAYFNYYQRQCELVRHGNRCITQTHQDLIDTIQLLREQLSTREHVKSRLRPKLPMPEPDDADEMLNNSIDLALRVWLMGNIGIFRRVLMPGRSLHWTEGCLGDFIMSIFPAQKVLKEHVKLEKLFNAYNLSRIAGIEIVWTSNLADHLRMQDDDTRIAIFHHAFFLESQLQW